MTTTGLALFNLRIEEANALTNIYTNGFPGLTNFVGFGKALEVKFINKFEKYSGMLMFKDIAVVLHSMDLKYSHPKYVRYQKGECDNGSPASTIDHRHLYMTISLFIEFRVDIDQLNDSNLDHDSLKDDLLGYWKDYYASFKIAGGRIRSIEDSRIDMPWHYFVKRLPYSAFILEDNFEDEVQPYLEEGGNLFNLFKYNRYKQGEENLPIGKYFLLQTGYRLLERPRIKDFSRNGYPHAFSEAVLMPVRLRTIASLRKNDGLNIFWHYDYNEYDKNSLILIKARSN